MRIVDLPTAKALEELGYDGEYYYRYYKGRLERAYARRTDTHLKAPRLDDVAYWIRDKYGLNIRISYIMLNECWFYDMLHLETNRYHDGDDWLYSDYDSALEAAVTKAIETIKNKKQ